MSQGHDLLQVMLVEVFAAFDREAISYCVLHGYQDLPHRVSSDVDMLIPAETRTARIVAVLSSLRHSRLVRHSSGGVETFVLASNVDSHSLVLLQLDVSRDVDLNRRLLVYDGQTIVQDRQRLGEFFVPSVRHAFVATLIRRLGKRNWQPHQQQHLSDLYRRDTSGCDRELVQTWGPRRARWIGEAVAAGRWDSVEARASALLRQLTVRATLRRPLNTLSFGLGGGVRRLRRWVRPRDGFHVTFLGPDGCGKSSVIAAIERDLSRLFAGTRRYSFPPRLLRRAVGVPSDPHGLTPRSAVSSVVRAIGYWGVYYTAGYYVTVHPALVGGRLVVHDRHLIDGVVDSRRYRYGGPPWLLQWLWRLVPRPDLVVLLDASAESIQGRKQEVSFEETARQCREYRRLVTPMANGRRIDASKPLDVVVREVCEAILQQHAPFQPRSD